MPKWEFYLSDLSGNVLGELTNAKSRSVTLGLNQMPTASFTLPVMHPMSPYLSNDDWDGLLKCYRVSSGGSRSLQFHGPVITSNEIGDASGPPSISVTASSPLWRLGFRTLGTSPTGWSKGDATTTFDLTEIAFQILADANAEGYTGIQAGTRTTTEQGAAGTYYIKPALQALAEISTGLNSFDFEVVPTEPTNVGQAWPQIGTFNALSVIGVNRPDSIFEFGTTKANVTSYTRQLDRTNLLTRAYINQPAATDHSGVLASSDAAAESVRGVFSGLVDDGGTTWNVLRQAIADENVMVRHKARQLVTILPYVNAKPEPLVDYFIGDFVRFRIYVSNLPRLDASLRVWGITFGIDDNGNETPTLTVQQPTTTL